MTTKFIPESLFEHGFTPLVSVIPPGAQLVPSSKIAPSQVGKVPGRRTANGLCAGYDWLRHEPTIDDVRGWCITGMSVGLRAEQFPAIDIDCTNERFAQMIEEAVVGQLGHTPRRIGKWPKRLFMYRLAGEPFGRLRLWFQLGEEKHLVEILGQGQQYLVHGTHPTTGRAYEWNVDIAGVEAAALPTLTREKAQELLDFLESYLTLAGAQHITREGTGKPQAERRGDATAFLAPTLDAVRAAVAVTPNASALFPDRQSYLTMGYAIKAACGEAHEDEAFGVFAEWAARWDGGVNAPDVVREDWRRMVPPFSVGWSWLAEQARQFGFNDAALEFEAVADAPGEAPLQAPRWSEQWLAERVAERLRGRLRYVPQKGTFLAWDSTRWQIDAELLAEDMIKQALRSLADLALREGATEKEKKEAEERALAICSARKASAVTQFVRSDRAVAVAMGALDHDAWLLNTPGGMVDLRTGALRPTDPDALCTKSTAVPPDFTGACPEFKRFLAEATGGDRALEAYLQRYAGYCLTGSTREQNVVFIYGEGGNGKSVFLNQLSGILGDYARVASMDTFTVSYGDKHATDVASLVGARLVTASETAAGKRWDAQRVTSLSGGEPVSARFMRQDFFTFLPQCKLLFVGNHRPGVDDVNEAMRRRIQIVPFTTRPARVDTELGAKLREEWPAILAWMIDGCLAWQEEGLNPPASVRASTEEYFGEEDAVGRWLAERTTRDDGGRVLTQTLWESWVEWANANGEFKGSQKRLVSALAARRLERWRDGETRRMGFKGIKVLDWQGAEFGS